jgi:hypothetical protein
VAVGATRADAQTVTARESSCEFVRVHLSNAVETSPKLDLRTSVPAYRQTPIALSMICQGAPAFVIVRRLDVAAIKAKKNA